MTGERQRVAIVTGASHGIGAAVAERLAKDGMAVVANYAAGNEQADALVAKIAATGGKAIAVKADVSDPAAVRALFDAAEQAFGGIDVLVNNAGVMHLTPIAEAQDDAFDKTIAVNLKGAFNGLREAGRRFGEGGRIVSFSSSVVGLYQPTYALYAATKAGIEAMTRIAAKELGPRGITVNAVSPGPVDTPLFTNGKSQEQIDAIRKANPFSRLGEPEDIARVVSFLVGSDGGWVNGQVLRANGGVI
ncbi:SDR family oxidoreductase [Aurantimonas sp. HBX-1]|uniref:SDR family oxidoreductase n=1 Tax=Aurantimonas sp. HBX-1 TaxID=2906072 RepID=UPI001F39590E|nr:SDR family oxidoreductase [Aurantimonas sp. HBX-1]UIJ71113.1 SDR family oxidoreductase [Aurantimonas sp. HBX-1]